ncbi:hypothetical protein C8R14_13511 [Nitrosomonas eutropha]|uniref:Transposase n=1 Tax=Nitrosomonas eutropha TaxID=916 RepID=A0ABX5M7D8_9PROT|nr:hypothetical protein C8R14_13511 [Nitrosomonas eutropha]
MGNLVSDNMCFPVFKLSNWRLVTQLPDLPLLRRRQYAVNEDVDLVHAEIRVAAGIKNIWIV